jgi:exocyst complex component 2
MQAFQRHLTTEAFKIAGGLDLNASSASKPVKQNRVALEFVTKITKSFLDALYAFLDGLVHLASDEVGYKKPIGIVAESANRFEAADLTNPVRDFCDAPHTCYHG